MTTTTLTREPAALGPITDETQYINLIKTIVKDGEYEMTRNGAALSIFGYSMRFSLRDGVLPLITTKKLAWKTCFKELMWFVRGETDNRTLRAQGVHIWDGNASREFLDSRGLSAREEGDLGPIYGHQWRHFGAPYTDCHADYRGQGIDQLANLIRDLKDPATRVSRRLVISAWNPVQIDEMALPPCHVLMQFHVSGNGQRLSCSLYQRSGDVGLGVPFNIASYSFLVHLLARHCDLEPWDFVYFLGNAHIYEAHLNPIMEQMLRRPYPFPRIHIREKRENIEDYSLEDIEWLESYQSHDAVKMEMIA
jgi:thymidylate synthase